MSSPEQQKNDKQPIKPESFSLEKEEGDLDYLMEELGLPFKELCRMIVRKEVSVEMVTNTETKIKSAIVKKGSEIIYSTSNEQEIAAFELLDKGEKYALEYFMSNDPEEYF